MVVDLKSHSFVKIRSLRAFMIHFRPTTLDIDVFCRTMEPFERLTPSEVEFALIKAIVCAQPGTPQFLA